MEKIIQNSVFQHEEAIKEFKAKEDDLKHVAEVLLALIKNDGHLFLCGNGGSAADAQHWSGEWRGRFEKERKPLRATALNVDTSTLTAIGNDYGYDQVFARQLRALGRHGDVFIGISTSGNSENIIKAVEVAKALGITTIGFLGRDGGKLKNIVDIPLVIAYPRTSRIQEMHELAMHIICELVDEKLLSL